MFYNEALKMMMMTKFFAKDKADAAEQRLLFCSDFEEKHQKFLIFIKTYQRGKKVDLAKKEKAKLFFCQYKNTSTVISKYKMY